MPPVWADRRGQDYCAQFSGSAVDGITVFLIETAGVFDVPPQIITADAIGTFFDGGFGQSDENDFRHTDVSAIDFDLHRHRINAQEGKCVEFDKHFDIIPDKQSRNRKIAKRPTQQGQTEYNPRD